MRAVVQRVSEASVMVDGQTVGAIRQGLMVLLGVARETPPETRFTWLKKLADCGSSKISREK